MNHPPLQYYLMSSKPGDCPQDNGDTSQRDVQFDQSPHGTAFLRREKRDSEFRIVPKTRTFLSPSKPERIISRKTLWIVSQKQMSKFSESKMLAEQMADSNRKGFPERLAYVQGAADGSKPFLKRINFLSAEKNRSCSAPRSIKPESSSSKSKILDRRLNFSIGKSNKNSSAEDAQTPPHLSTTLVPLRAGLDNRSRSYFSESSSLDNTSTTATRGRSSPLRRLLDPLIRPKSSHVCRSPEPSLKGAHQKHIFSLMVNHLLQPFYQEMDNNKQQPFLSFTPYREGVYTVEYNTSLSLLQAFSICIAVNVRFGFNYGLPT
ncbi:unnamed protein product [Brassica napus]|uniref:(rape) hypothetical protein n=1 Tax=Brassica napus TaxID=3708 RepID=A0A816I5V9_BRANA|nr:unnamed protein product [Brassica napus]